METILLTTYILAWPVLSTVMLVIIFSATLKDLRAARRDNHSLV